MFFVFCLHFTFLFPLPLSFSILPPYFVICHTLSFRILWGWENFHSMKKTGSETLPQNVWKRVSLRVISYLFLKEVTFHTPSRFFEHYLVLFHTSCRHTSYLLVFIPIMTRFHTTRYIHTYILVLHTYTTSYSLRLSFIPGRLFTLWTLHTYLLLLHTCSSSYMFLLKFILTLHFLLLNVFIIHKHNSYQSWLISYHRQ